MRITVLGTGYVGLVAGACFSDSGTHVTCVDVDKKKIDALKKGKIPFYEPGLEEIVLRNIKAGRLTFSTETAQAVAESRVVFIAVGTPQGDDGAAELKYVVKAVDDVCKAITRDILLVLKSTVPVGTADKIRKQVAGAPHPIEVVSNPEFLKEGAAIGDFMRPERVIVGTESESARRIMGSLYAPFVRNGSPILYMNNQSAEMAKYAANSFLAMKISFINQIAVVAEKVGADIHDVRRGIITDSRIGSKFLYPGCGYGGSCFPKDVVALIHLGKELKLPLDLFREVHEINERQKRLLFEKIHRKFQGNLAGKTVAVWGLAFKPETDDMREAPSVVLIQELLKNKAAVRAYDPIASEEAHKIFGDSVTLVDEPYEAAKGADALALLTEWNEFRSPNFDRLKENLRTPLIFDGRNLYNRELLKDLGFSYVCIGRPELT